MVHTTTGSAVLRVAAALWIVAGLWYLGTEAVIAKHWPGYSYSKDYISAWAGRWSHRWPLG